MKISEIKVKNILSKSNLPVSDFSANPYVGCGHACKYCYASFMKRFTNHPEPWGEFIDVKDWPAIRNPEKYRGKEIFLSSVTDPYQPVEEKYGRTRKLLEQLQESGCKLSIATKSDLALRDLDLLKTFPDVRVSWSINTLEEEFRRQMDKGAPIEKRIEAMRIFHEAGITTTCFISPIFPGITKPIEIIKRTKDCCDLVWLENLNLRGAYKHEILDFIDTNYPRLSSLYRDIYTRKDKSYWNGLDTNYPRLSSLYRDIYTRKDKSYWHGLDEKIAVFAKKEGLKYVRNGDPDIRQEKILPVIVNYFFHEEIVKKSQANSVIII